MARPEPVDHDAGTEHSPPSDLRARGRPRCEGVESERAPDGGREIRVTLAWPHGRRTISEATGVGLPEAEMRAAAEATLAAVLEGAGQELHLRLRGAKSVKAFDHLVVIVAVEWDHDGARRPLLGCVAAPDSDRIRGAVLATLDAVNRVIEGGPARRGRAGPRRTADGDPGHEGRGLRADSRQRPGSPGEE